ncbi:MAG: NAD(P)-dependent oxidoreductase [Dehalococcoidia bacterium]
MTKEVVLLAPDDSSMAERMAEFQAVAKRLGEDIEIKFVDASLPADDIVQACNGAVAIIPGRPRALTTEIAERLPNLRLVQTTSAGTDWLDKSALAELGIDVSNNGGANAVAVAEHAIGLMFSVYRKLDMQIDSVKAGTWMAGVTGDPGEFHTLVGKRVGIVGLGRIGSRVAKRLAGWECEIVYHDVAKFTDEYEQAAGARKVPFDELLSTSDIVTLHTPLERTTHHLMSDREFDLMKPTAILINTCRGPVVDEAALTRALEAGKIFGAGLDVTEIEPIEADNPLPTMPNVIVTPHLATRAIESTINAANFAVANTARLARGEKPESIVPPV